MKPRADNHIREASTPPHGQGKRYQRNDRGFVLIASLLILVILNLIQLSMARSFWMEESKGGNSREKARALRGAESALSYAESWLKNATAVQKTDVTCAAGSITETVCKDTVGFNPSTLTARTSPFTTWVKLSVANSPYWTAKKISKSGGAGTYYGAPGFYIQSLSGNAAGSAEYYRVTAFGHGGNKEATAVTQSLYQIDVLTNSKGNTIKNLGGL